MCLQDTHCSDSGYNRDFNIWYHSNQQNFCVVYRYKKLNAALVSLIEDYGLVSFLPLSIKHKHTLLRLKNAVDKANGYIYGTGEEKSVQALLACAVGGEYEIDRTGKDQDVFMPAADEDMCQL